MPDVHDRILSQEADPGAVPGSAAWQADPGLAESVSGDKLQRRLRIAELIDLVVGDLNP
jgi:hypothetical protein